MSEAFGINLVLQLIGSTGCLLGNNSITTLGEFQSCAGRHSIFKEGTGGMGKIAVILMDGFEDEDYLCPMEFLRDGRLAQCRPVHTEDGPLPQQ